MHVRAMICTKGGVKNMSVYFIVKNKSGEVVRAETTDITNVRWLTKEYLNKGHYVEIRNL